MLSCVHGLPTTTGSARAILFPRSHKIATAWNQRHFVIVLHAGYESLSLPKPTHPSGSPARAPASPPCWETFLTLPERWTLQFLLITVPLLLLVFRSAGLGVGEAKFKSDMAMNAWRPGTSRGKRQTRPIETGTNGPPTSLWRLKRPGQPVAVAPPQDATP